MARVGIRWSCGKFPQTSRKGDAMNRYSRELSESYLFRYLAAESKRRKAQERWWKATIAFFLLSIFLLGFSAGRLSV